MYTTEYLYVGCRARDCTEYGDPEPIRALVHGNRTLEGNDPIINAPSVLSCSALLCSALLSAGSQEGLLVQPSPCPSPAPSPGSSQWRRCDLRCSEAPYKKLSIVAFEQGCESLRPVVGGSGRWTTDTENRSYFDQQTPHTTPRQDGPCARSSTSCLLVANEDKTVPGG